MMITKGAILTRLFLFSVLVQVARANVLHAMFQMVDDTPIDDQLDKLTSQQHIVERQKRQEVTLAPAIAISTLLNPLTSYVCPTELYRRMDKCCKVPQLYPTDVLNKCTGRNLLMALPKGPRKNIRPVQLRFRKNFLITNPKNASIKSRIEDILAPENFVDENLMYAGLAVLVPPGPYQTLIQTNVRTECSQISGFDFGNFVYNMYGQKCMLAPFRLIRCMKRSMILAYNTCPGQIGGGQQCDLDKAYLRQCDPFAV